MEVRVWEYPVDPPAHGAQLGHAALLDADSAGEVFVAVQETRGAVQGVSEAKVEIRKCLPFTICVRECI